MEPGEAGGEGGKSRNDRIGEGRQFQDAGRQQRRRREGQDCVAAPGMESRIELDEEQAVTMEIRASARSNAHPPTSVEGEDEGGGVRKSEAPVVARNAGNAAGAKGCRRETTGRGNMARH